MFYYCRVGPKTIGMILHRVLTEEELSKLTITDFRRYSAYLIQYDQITILGHVFRKSDYFILRADQEYCFINEKAFNIIYNELVPA